MREGLVLRIDRARKGFLCFTAIFFVRTLDSSVIPYSIAAATKFKGRLLIFQRFLLNKNAISNSMVV